MWPDDVPKLHTSLSSLSSQLWYPSGNGSLSERCPPSLGHLPTATIPDPHEGKLLAQLTENMTSISCIHLSASTSISVHPHPSHASIFTHPPHTSISRIHLMHPSHTSTSYIHHLIHPSHTSIFHASISRIHLVHPSHTFISCIHLVHPSHASISHIHLKEDIWIKGTSEHLPQVRFLHWIEDTLLNLPLVISSNS